MTFKDVVVFALLALGVGLQLLTVLGLIAMRDTFARLHYLGLSSFGLAAVAAAILVQESFSMIGDKAVATAVIVLVTGPVLIHVTARTARIREHGRWEVGSGEKVGRVGS
jgi:multisubunit Na+/H+ antiporter MnhG subunit